LTLTSRGSILQTSSEHAHTKRVVQDFLKHEGPELHQKLKDYASTRASYIEEWWTESYLSHSESVVLSLNPFFILESVHFHLQAQQKYTEKIVYDQR
jgi:hypothetical protein